MERHLKNLALLVLVLIGWNYNLAAANSSTAQQNLNQVLLGKDVRALTEMPAYKDGVDIYYTPPSGKRTDDRGLDLGAMTKWLKDKGVGVDRDEWTTITNVKFDTDMI